MRDIKTDPISRRSIRIAIFTENDTVWTFPAWSRAIPRLQEGFEVIGIYVFDRRRYKGKGGSLWYLRKFARWRITIAKRKRRRRPPEAAENPPFERTVVSWSL